MLTVPWVWKGLRVRLPVSTAATATFWLPGSAVTADTGAEYSEMTSPLRAATENQ